MRRHAAAISLLFFIMAFAGCIGNWSVVASPSDINASTASASMPANAGVEAIAVQGETGNESGVQDAGTAGQLTAGESAAVPELEKLSVGHGSLPAYGNESAPVEWIEFSDYQCPYCARLFSQADGSVRENYVSEGRVRMYFRDYPLAFHAKSQDAAIAARCAWSQGKFWDMHDMIFSGQDSWSGLSGDDAVARFKSYASSLGLNSSEFSSCVSGASAVHAIASDQQEGNEYGVSGTPAVFLLLPKGKTNYGSLKSVEDSSYGGVKIYDGGDDYVALVSGAYPYSTFSAILDSVSYD